MNKKFILGLVFILTSYIVHCQLNTYSISRYNGENDTTYLTNDNYSKFIYSPSYVQLKEIILTEMKNDSKYTAKVYFEFFISETGYCKIVRIKTDLCLKESVLEKISKNFNEMIDESIHQRSDLINSLIIVPMFFHFDPGY